MKTTITLMFGIFAGLLPAADLQPSDWAQWRGANRDGLVASDQAWPSSLDKTSLKERWSTELSPSYSGPIVVGSMVFTTETVDKQTERVAAFDRNSGEKRWEVEWGGAMKVPFFAASNGSWIRATPASDGKSLFVAGIRDVLVSLDVKTGKENWRFDFVKELETPLPSFGMVCSPLLDDEHVYVQAGAGFCKLDKSTGKLVWRTATDKGGMFGSAFSSPVRATIAGRDVFVVQSRLALQIVDAASGKVEVSQPIKAFRGMNILTPLVVNDTIFTSAYGGRSHLFEVTAEGGKLQLTERWSTKHQGYMSTPVVIEDVAYFHLKNQRLLAMDLKTGKELWIKSDRFGKYWSMVTDGQSILALDQDGTLRLLKADREKFQELDARELADDSWAHIAISNRQIFVRDLNKLTVYDWLGSGRPIALNAE